MTPITYYKKELFSLASLLNKLYKVTQHPDPSAEQKKKLLYKKYRNRVQILGEQIKLDYSWHELAELIKKLPIQKKLSTTSRMQISISKRLAKDFELFFITRQKLEELKSTGSKRNTKKKSPTTHKKMAPVPPANGIYTKESLKELVHHTKQQHLARKNLAQLVDVIKKIGPDKLEKKINEVSSRAKPS